MTEQKFTEQISTVAKFIQIYCDDNHAKAQKSNANLELIYKNTSLSQSVNYNLCKECEHLLLYANERLQNCPHDEKPKCRKCPHICYEKSELKFMVKVMRSSGIKLGLSKIKSLFQR